MNEGRYAVLGSDSDSLNQYLTFTNFFQYSQITPIDPKDDNPKQLTLLKFEGETKNNPPGRKRGLLELIAKRKYSPEL